MEKEVDILFSETLLPGAGIIFSVAVIMLLLGKMIDTAHDDRMSRRIQEYEESRGRGR